MKYLVQAILIDNTGRNVIETVIDSFRTDDYQRTLDRLMKKHRFLNKYMFNVMEIETQKLILTTTKNKYYDTLYNIKI